jgi:two-component system OmpR family sensor kinase
VSLRARLVGTTLVLFTIGLLVAGAATFGFLRTFLVRRVDQQLQAVRGPAVRSLFEAASGRSVPQGSGLGRGPGGGPRTILPPGAYAELRSADGQRLASASFSFDDTAAVTPTLPDRLPTPTGPLGALFTTGGAERFRALVQQLDDGRLAVVAIPLRDVEETLRRLVAVEVLVAAGVLGAIAVSSLALIRRELRPLDRMGDTAGAIAAGDLSRRVEPAGGGTEIGRLGAALNAMLGQIEASFEERRATEQRLRQFLSDASHELRTPLTSIRGWAELFRRGAKSRPADLARTMRRIEDEAAHMTVLVEEMLSLARLDEGRPLAREPVDLAQVAVDAVDDARAVEPERPVTLDTPPRLMVDADPVRMREVLSNLLSNARRHTPATTPVHVRLSIEGDDAVMEVADEGPGMTTEEAARAFERFYRGDGSRARGTGGAGLGLAIVAAIAEAHGGVATVAAAPGKGATFRVAIPTASPAS